MDSVHRALVGRDEELAAIARMLRSGRNPALVGAVGVGTTSLAAEALKRFARGAPVHRLVGSPGPVSVPLAVLHPLLGEATIDDVFAEVAAALGDDAVLLVDDAHLLDDASATVIHQLVVGGGARIALTFRAGAPLPPALARLLREPSVDRLEVDPLPTAVIHDLLRDLLDGPVDGRTLHRLGELSEGRPLYLHELVEAGRAAGCLSHQGLIARFVGDVVLSPVLRDVLDERFGVVGAPALVALELIAVAEGLPLDVASHLVDTGDLDHLERAGLVRIVDTESGPVAEVVRALDQEVLAQRVGRVGRIDQSRRLAEAADAVGYAARGPAAARRAVTWALRGGLAPDGVALAAAARDAAEVGSARLGSELAVAAFAKQQDATSALLGAWCLSREGDHAGALGLLSEALAVVEDPWERSRVQQQAADQHWWWLADLAVAREMVDPATLPDGPWQDTLVAQGAMFDFLDGSVAAGLAALDSLQRPGAGHSRFIADLARGLALALSDRGAEAVAVSDAARAAVAESGRDLLGNPEFHVLSAVLGLLYDGQVIEAAAVADLVYEVAMATAEPDALAWAAHFVGVVALFRGDLAKAAEHLAEAEATFVECSLQGVARWATAARALTEFQRGDPLAGTGALQRLDQYVASGFTLYEPSVGLARAWQSASEGRRADAAAEATAAAEVAVASGAWSQVAHIAHDVGRFGEWASAVALIDLLPGPRSALTEARIGFLRSADAGDGDGLDAAATTFAALGGLLFAAEAAALAAAAHQRAGRPRQATASSTRMTVLLEACPGAATPPLTRSPRVALTPREREVAVLAAAGRTNREIADQLGRSERTVENHLYRAFTKLGVTGRADLATALDARGG